LGTELSLSESKIKEIVAAEEAKALPRMEQVRRRLPRLLPGPEVAIVADSPNAAGLTLLARELDLIPAVVALTDRLADPEKRYRELTATPELITRPTLPGLRELPERHAFHLAIRPDLSLAGTAWEELPTVEYGFPANRKHFVYPMPELGYAGAVALAQRIMDAASGAH
jgi:nitrogenase molybdenum-iron protein alpha/beta subunit